MTGSRSANGFYIGGPIAKTTQRLVARKHIANNKSAFSFTAFCPQAVSVTSLSCIAIKRDRP